MISDAEKNSKERAAMKTQQQTGLLTNTLMPY